MMIPELSSPSLFFHAPLRGFTPARLRLVATPAFLLVMAALIDVCFSTPCQAMGAPDLMADSGLLLGEVIMIIVTASAVIALILLAYQNARQNACIEQLKQDIDTQHLKAQTSNNFTDDLLSLDLQLFIVWQPGQSEPQRFGQLRFNKGETLNKDTIWPLSRWMAVEHLEPMESLISTLRQRGQSFSKVVETLTGQDIEILGRPLGTNVVLCIRPCPGSESEKGALARQYDKLSQDRSILITLLNQLPDPCWRRTFDGRIVWMNNALRECLSQQNETDSFVAFETFFGPRHVQISTEAVANGMPKQFQFTCGSKTPRTHIWNELPIHGGGVGFARDISRETSFEKSCAEKETLFSSILSKMPTAVIFLGDDHRVQSVNETFCQMFGFDTERPKPGLLMSTLLQKLRERDCLPQESGYTEWRDRLLKSVKAKEPVNDSWFLGDQRKLEVKGAACASGYLFTFHDATSSYQRERNYLSLQRTQQETINNLQQAILVFGRDGRLIQHNKAFFSLWRLKTKDLGARPHIESLTSMLGMMCESTQPWKDILYAITDFRGRRKVLEGRMTLKTGEFFDYKLASLPDGSSLLTFSDQTDSINVDLLNKEKAEEGRIREELHRQFLDQFMSEVKTPLNDIVKQARKGRKSAGKPDSKTLLSTFSELEAESEEVGELIKRAEDWLALTYGKVRLRRERINLFITGHEIITELSEEMDHKSLYLVHNEFDVKATAILDKSHYSSALRRLVRLCISLARSESTFTVNGHSNRDRLSMTFTFLPDDEKIKADDLSHFTAAITAEAYFHALDGGLICEQDDKAIHLGFYLPNTDRPKSKSKTRKSA